MPLGSNFDEERPSPRRLWDDLNPGDVHVWAASLVQPPSVLSQLRRVLDDDEKARADRFKFERGQRQFTVGRGLLRLLVGYYLALDPTRVAFRYNAYGKPELDLEGRGLKFNLSHSGELVFYAVSLDREVGVDVETIRPEFASEAIAERFFSAAERARLRALDLDVRTQAFFTCWTRKEAFIKARGKGMAIPLDAFEVTLEPDLPPAIVATYDDPDEAKRWSLYELDPGAGYVAALAAAGESCRVHQRDLPLSAFLNLDPPNDAV
ncbi:4'-phosphopantetheinyl transferase family protein [Singulisphaera sp. PoT]|uniref:4'-phosphopantetheinyl transferase family protein n=1 Tax=Singulisphaera sp. PoT TaxID=3411797 RepID=UPI003BF49489